MDTKKDAEVNHCLYIFVFLFDMHFSYLNYLFHSLRVRVCVRGRAVSHLSARMRMHVGHDYLSYNLRVEAHDYLSHEFRQLFSYKSLSYFFLVIFHYYYKKN